MPTATAAQPSPTTRGLSGRLPSGGSVPDFFSPSVTVVPGGGLNSNWRASGLAKSMLVKPTSKAGLDNRVE